MAAVEANAAAPLSLPRVSASAPPTVGALLTRVSAATVTNSGGASRERECSSPRSLLSRILHRRRGGGFGCRLRLPLPRYCSSGAAKEDTPVAAAAVAAKEEAAAPKVVASREARESPRSSLSGKKAPGTADDAVPAASLGLGASLVLLLSKSAAELSRMAELRAQMERLMLDVRADVRSSCNGSRPSASDGRHIDSASVVKEEQFDVDEAALSPSRGFPASRGGSSEDAGHRETMDQMEAELEAELSRLQQMASNDEETVTPRRDHHQVEIEEAKNGATSGSPLSVICSDSDIDDGATDHDGDESQEEGDEEEEDNDNDDESDDTEEGQAKSPPHGGVSARELERRLHELLQSRHETRIAELEAALERAWRKLKEKEREACRWRDTAKLAARFTDDSRLR